MSVGLSPAAITALVIGALIAACSATHAPGPRASSLPTASLPAVTLPSGVPPPPSGLQPPSFDLLPPPSGLEPPPSGFEPPVDSAPPAEDSTIFSRHADPTLEALMPVEVSGVPLTTFSLGAADFISPANQMQFDAFLGSIDHTPSDVTLARGIDPTGRLAGSVSALRVAGSDAAAVLPAFLAVQTREANPPTLAETTIGGRTVATATYATTSGPIVEYLLTAGEVIFIVSAVDTSTAASFIEALP